MARTETAGNLITRAKERADMENSNFISDAEWYRSLNVWTARLWNLLVKADPDRYTRAQTLAADGSTVYDCAADYMGTVRVDYQTDSSQSIWVEIPRLYGTEENRLIQDQSDYPRGYTFRYNATTPSTQQITILPPSSYAMRHLYIVAPPSYATDGTDSAELVMGISGFEEYVVIGMAIDARIKEESSVVQLRQSQADITAHLEEAAENRSVSDAGHVTDVRSSGYIDAAGIRWGRRDF